jgi:ABC-2 type transport system ATP-binding protein
LDYYGRLFHQPRRQRHSRTDQLLEYVGLDRVANRPVGEFSKGMQRRIGLAQALINDPELLILDEPTTGMDPIGTRQIKDLILDLRDRGKTIVLSSHLLADVEDVTDRVVIMFGGRIRKAGTVDDLLIQQSRTTLHSQSLDQQTIDEIERVLERHGHHIEAVEHPRQKLEQLFLQIVHEAQAEGADTSGATSGGRLAEFLTGAHLREDADPRAVLDALMTAQPEPAATPAPPTPIGQQDGPESGVLDNLLGKKDDTPPTQRPGTPAKPGDGQARDDEDQPDDDVLDQLMGKPMKD